MTYIRKSFLCLTLLFLATVSGSTTSWNPVRVGGYGPVLGYQSPALTASTPLADTLLWRSRGIDPSGFYNLGTRYYDPLAGHFLSADPLGHASSMDLHSFCDGDPINRFDPTGRYSKDAFNVAQGLVAGLADAGENGSSSYGAVLGRSSGVQGAYGIGSTMGQVGKALAMVGGLFVAPEVEEGVLAGEELAEGGLLAEEGFNLGAEANLARETVLPEAETVLSTETEAALPALKSANSFGESGQGEFGFVKGLESTPARSAVQTSSQSAAIESSIGTSQVSQSAAAELSGGTSQASQSELNFNSAIEPYSGPTASGWPGNRGFLTGPFQTELRSGTLIDRFGPRSGTFVAPKGTPFQMRGLPAQYETEMPHETYEVVSPFNVKSGLSAPAFNQMGLGRQYELPLSVQELRDLGLLKLK